MSARKKPTNVVSLAEYREKVRQPDAPRTLTVTPDMEKIAMLAGILGLRLARLPDELRAEGWQTVGEMLGGIQNWHPAA